MRILVTGATGLIGAHAVARLLEEGHVVRAFVREPAKLDRVLAPFAKKVSDIEVARGDVCDARSVEAALAGCSGLLHAAGVFSPELSDAEKLWAVNVEGTRVVLDAAVEAGLARIVFLSSILALFPPKGPVMSADDDVADPSSMYARTKAEADRIARARQAEGKGEGTSLTIVYPAACHGPDDPTLSVGPQLVANALRDGKVLVTEGGLPYTDVRDLVRVIAAIFEMPEPPARLMGPAFFVTHERCHALLSELTGRKLGVQRVPGRILRAMGRLGDLAQRFGRTVQLTSEAAAVLTRSVPVDDRAARLILSRCAADVRPAEASFRDLIVWMHAAGHVEASQVGQLAGDGERRVLSSRWP